MKKGIMIIGVLLLVFMFVSCVSQTEDKTVSGTDWSRFVEVREVNGKQQLVTKTDIVGVECQILNCSEDEVAVNGGLYILNSDDEQLNLSIAYGKIIEKGTTLAVIPADASLEIKYVIESISQIKREVINTRNNDTPVLLGDFNHDSYVDLEDFFLLKTRYNLNSGEQDYLTNYDIYPAEKTFTETQWQDIYSKNLPDGTINLGDFIIFTFNYRKSVYRIPVLNWVDPIDNNVSGESTVSWSAENPDNNAITYYIHISEDGTTFKAETLNNSTETTCSFTEGKSYTFTLTATPDVNDNITAAATSITRTLTMNIRPQIIKLSGVTGITYDATAVFTWNASDTDGFIDHAEYKLDDGQWLTTENSTLTLNATAGAHTVSVRVVDNDGKASDVIFWDFIYFEDRPSLYLEYSDRYIYLKSENLISLQGISCEIDFTENLELGELELNEDLIHATLLSTENTNGVYNFDIGFWELMPTLDATILKVRVISASTETYCTFNSATVVNVFDENIYFNPVDCTGTTVPEIVKEPIVSTSGYYGDTGEDILRAGIETSSGAFLSVGNSASDNLTGVNNGTDAWVVKTDKNSNLLWQKCFGGNNTDQFFSVVEVGNKEYIAVGNTSSSDLPDYHSGIDGLVVKFKDNGERIWQKCFGGSGNDIFWSICNTSDGNVVVAGYSASTNGQIDSYFGQHDGWIVKLKSSDGSIMWQYNSGGSNIDYFESIRETSDNCLIAVGTTNSNHLDGRTDHDVWIVKLESSGDLEWEKTIGSTGTDYALSVVESSEGNFVIVGDTTSNSGNFADNHGSTDAFALKLNSNGNLIWQKCFGGSYVDSFTSIDMTNDGNYIVSGHVRSEDGDFPEYYGDYDACLVKLDDAGKLIWHKIFGGSTYDSFQEVFNTQSGRYLLSGYSYFGSTSDGWIVEISD